MLNGIALTKASQKIEAAMLMMMFLSAEVEPGIPSSFLDETQGIVKGTDQTGRNFKCHYRVTI